MRTPKCTMEEKTFMTPRFSKLRERSKSRTRSPSGGREGNREGGKKCVISGNEMAPANTVTSAVILPKLLLRSPRLPRRARTRRIDGRGLRKASRIEVRASARRSFFPLRQVSPALPSVSSVVLRSLMILAVQGKPERLVSKDGRSKSSFRRPCS